MESKSSPETSSPTPWRKAFYMERKDSVGHSLIIQMKKVTYTWSLTTTSKRKSFVRSWRTISRSCRSSLSTLSRVKRRVVRDSIKAHSTTLWTWLVQLAKTSCLRRRYRLPHRICTKKTLPLDHTVQIPIINVCMIHSRHFPNGKAVLQMKLKESRHLQTMLLQNSGWLTIERALQSPPSRRM